MYPSWRVLKLYLHKALSGFKHDPPDSDFQRGYQAALIEIARMFTPLKVESYKSAEVAQVVPHPISDELEDMHQKVARAHNMIMDAKAIINEAWDLINSVPKRIGN